MKKILALLLAATLMITSGILVFADETESLIEETFGHRRQVSEEGLNEKHDEMTTLFTEFLADKVAEGALTQAEADALVDATPEEHRATMEELDFRTWLESSDYDLPARGNRGEREEKIALTDEEVAEREAQRAEQKEAMLVILEEFLAEKVADGTLTQVEADALVDQTTEEHRTQMQALDFKAWIEASDYELPERPMMGGQRGEFNGEKPEFDGERSEFAGERLEGKRSMGKRNMGLNNQE